MNFVGGGGAVPLPEQLIASPIGECSSDHQGSSSSNLENGLLEENFENAVYPSGPSEHASAARRKADVADCLDHGVKRPCLPSVKIEKLERSTSAEVHNVVSVSGFCSRVPPESSIGPPLPSPDSRPIQSQSLQQPLHLVGGSCIYCGFEIKKPWDLVTHMVEKHDVQITTLDCGIDLEKNLDEKCQFCDHLFTLAHDLFYHLLIGHAKKIFGRDALSDYCTIEMLTVDHKKLTLKVRINRKNTQQNDQLKDQAQSSSFIAQSNLAGSQAVPAPSHLPVGRAPAPMSRSRRSAYELPHEIPQDLIVEAESQIRPHDKGYQCAYCYKVRETREEAIAHIYKIHMCAALRRFQCPQCPKCYDSMKNLQTHVNACHTQTRMYSCPNCPMKYKYPGDLKRHQTRNVCDKYKQGGYPCVKCGMMWYHQSALSSHQRQCDGVC